MAYISILLLLLSPTAFSHGVDDSTRLFLQQVGGAEPGALFYIGAKHMVSGYDHLLFLLGVVFFLRCGRDILLYVSLFTLGHSLTLIGAVMAGIQANAWLIDAIIGLSVVWKGFDNLGGWQHWRWIPDNRVMVLVFGLFHGLGLATKLQEFHLPADGLLANLLAFNIGVETGQVLALMWILLALQLLRKLPGHRAMDTVINTLLMTAGLVLTGYQLTGLWLNS